MTREDMKNCIDYLHTILGIPYTVIAAKSEISGTHLTLWLKGDKNLSDKAFERICDYYKNLQKEVEWIL